MTRGSMCNAYSLVNNATNLAWHVPQLSFDLTLLLSIISVTIPVSTFLYAFFRKSRVKILSSNSHFDGRDRCLYQHFKLEVKLSRYKGYKEVVLLDSVNEPDMIEINGVAVGITETVVPLSQYYFRKNDKKDRDCSLVLRDRHYIVTFKTSQLEVFFGFKNHEFMKNVRYELEYNELTVINSNLYPIKLLTIELPKGITTTPLRSNPNVDEVYSEDGRQFLVLKELPGKNTSNGKITIHV